MKTFGATPILAVAYCLTMTVQAQIGSGWTQISPAKTLQRVGGITYSNVAGVETFSITNNDNSNEERVEQRIQDDYSSGTHQFEGYLKVVSLSGNYINLKQTFQANNGAWFLFTVDSANGGTLRDHGPGTILATNVLGNMIRLNTIHNMNAGALYVYVNGVLVETKTGGTTPFYDKYGTYRAASGYGPVTAQWTNVRLWTGGSTNASASGTFTNSPGITSIKLIGQNMVLTGTNGQSGDAYYLLQSKNVVLPLSQWSVVATNVLSANGNFTFTGTNVVTLGVAQQFYILSNTNSNH